MADKPQRCPPHHWEIDETGISAKCKYCPEERHDLVNDLDKPKHHSTRCVKLSPTGYRSKEEYIVLKVDILRIYSQTKSISKTSQAFDPPLPRTSLRQLLKDWTQNGVIEEERREFLLQPGTEKVVFAGSAPIMRRFDAYVQNGQLDIIAEGTTAVKNRYLLKQRGTKEV